MKKRINKELIYTLIALGHDEFAFTWNLLKDEIIKNNWRKSKLGNLCLENALDGNTKYQFLVSKMYQWGVKFDIDSEMSVYWVKTTKDQRYPPSLFYIANLHFSGTKDFELDKQKFIELLTESASQNYIPALNLLGFYYYEGADFLKKDIELAISFYNTSVSLGNSKALVELLKIFVKMDDDSLIKEYIELVILAAKDGCHFSSEFLANVYFHGKFGFNESKKLYKFYSDQRNIIVNAIVNECSCLLL